MPSAEPASLFSFRPALREAPRCSPGSCSPISLDGSPSSYFRASALYQPAVPSGAGGARLVLSAVVHCHNALGRGYLAVIAPFHRRVARSLLRHAARIGWPGEGGGSGMRATADRESRHGDLAAPLGFEEQNGIPARSIKG